ncbi:olfactory receptor 1019-like isoform X1 [Hyla sarda]|uniref:olfactory receptor 1019-like isoform X1 n=1 Tax=Hyla sarda TaxID=327740 RepID=UPI0024C3C677|nr:olfactory receptor 1019-like isoform X1 [Hyla sarda]XP_056395200.1 olfactory receptor 1019-like isoform X1 [Hyla sarda]XP_056395202.1 olfactory receptor 1019-like isoform X1 [Hyla sarda]XP_056395203.1 olfactory receptor 1019-like isoform X1 [Hyla sarda]XP_056395204.1 olfactory receptor 1019-like isoform X1 [Hyla sarda]
MNETTIQYFIIKGISDVPELQMTIFTVVLLIYLITIGGNMVILILVCVDSHLHSPMYFFLANLSIVDMASSTTSLHKILISFITGDETVSFYGCMTQSFMSGSFTVHELFILTAMSYDRYLAICRPLNYHLLMNHRTCILLASSCWTLGFLFVSPLVGILSSFSCYTSIEINHFLCDIVPLLNITCSDTFSLSILFFIEGLFLFTVIPFILTFLPYIFIIVAIMKIRTSNGRHKAFYTCSSHLTVVILLYTLLISQYLGPSSSSNVDSKKLYALFNMAAVPLLNPVIYSLKNKDVKVALRRRFGQKP